MFEFVERAVEGMEQSRKTIAKGQKLRLFLWIAEMCLKYNKKPEEIKKLLQEVEKLNVKKKIK